jgi:putative transposase
MGRIDPVECIGVSGQRNGNALNVKPPAMRVRDECYTKNHLSIIHRGVQATIKERKGDFMAKQTNSLAHTKWMCKYHIIFTPKYRRKIVYNQYKTDLRDILKQLCSYKGVEILEGHLMPDHVHMLVSIPPKISVSSFMGYLKGKSALMMFDRHANLKYKFGNRHFWSEGYYVSTVGLNEATIKKYIQEQEKADIMQDKLSVKEYEDPFKGQG